MQRRSLVIAIAAIPVLWFFLGESSGARWVIEKAWPDLQKEADVIVIVTVTSTTDLAKDDTKEIQTLESRLRVLTVLKGQGVPPQLQLLHYRYKRSDELGTSPVTISSGLIFNSCNYLELKVTPEVDDPPPDASDESKADASFRRRHTEMPAREGQYLMFLNRQADGLMVPATGHCDAENSIFTLTKAETIRP